MSTASDLIKSSLRVIGAIASGETPSASEQADALDALNDILEEWSNDGFMIFERTIEEFTLTPSTGAYTIGDGATFDTARPFVIDAVKFKQAGQNTEYPGDVYNSQEWARITDRTLQGQLPECVYYNPTFPSGTLNFWPVPSEENTVVIYSLKPLTALANASATLSYPPGYKKALKYALAAELAPEYGQASNPKIEDIANKARTAIQRTNTEPMLLVSDAYGLNECPTFDIYKGPA